MTLQMPVTGLRELFRHAVMKISLVKVTFYVMSTSQCDDLIVTLFWLSSSLISIVPLDELDGNSLYSSTLEKRKYRIDHAHGNSLFTNRPSA